MVLRVTDPSFPGKLYVAKEDIVAIYVSESEDVYIFMKGVTGKAQISREHLKENDPLYDILRTLVFN